jgi:hypothetical protein
MSRECTYTADVGIGARGARARLVQEWLCLNGHSVAVDGQFGPASAAATRLFQQKAKLPVTGTVDRRTFERLVAPMVGALAPIDPPSGATLGDMVVAYAEQHLAAAPREVGGQNRGPWVRLYMDGKQGAEWPWCAGFASFVMREAAESLDAPLPLEPSFSCDLLAADAKANGCFCAGSARVVPPARVRAGALFLNRRTAGDWVHVGIVTSAEAEVFHTIEGNTNDAGDREGYEVCRRVRGYRNKDFVVLDAE